MQIIQPHSHGIARTAQDYERMAMSGVVAVAEPAFWAGFDRAYPEIAIDTMILLSDGAPTDDDVDKVNLMAPQIILDHVKEWNVNRRIVIHCIGVDMVEGIEFLRELAAENGGEYIDR